MGNVLILGATSGIARAVAAELARGKHDLVLAGRDLPELQAMATDLSLRHGVKARTLQMDFLDFGSHERGLRPVLTADGISGAVVCFGYLGDQKLAQTDFAEARRILDTNFTACVSVCNLLAHHFEQRRTGFLCVLSSVAGDRGRQSNYTYGAAKGALSLYLQGLRNRLFPAGVRVITVKPGFVNTKMTYGKEGMFLVAEPEAVARGIVKAIERGADVVYLPFFWRWIMLIIRSIPERVFKRMKL